MTPRRVLQLAVAILFPLAANADEPPSQGMICIAPFHAEPGSFGVHRPPMPDPTWGIAPNSIFEFRIDGRLRATVTNAQMAMISGLPTDRRIKVLVVHNHQPYETVSVDFRRQPEPRICLWMDPGRWRWINIAWKEALGCRCKP